MYTNEILEGIEVLGICDFPGGGNSILPIIKELAQFRTSPQLILTKNSNQIFDPSEFTFEIVEPPFFKNDIEKRIKGLRPKICIIGTSAELINHDNKLEVLSTEILKELNIPVISILDDRSHSFERYSNRDKLIEPDLIFVPDAETFNELKQRGFTKEKIIISGNPYLEFIEKNMDSLPVNHFKRNRGEVQKILFLSQPYLESGIFGEKYNEVTILKEIVEVCQNEFQGKFEIVIKTHPRDDVTKYAKYDQGRIVDTLSYSEVENFDYVIGINTALLKELSILGYRVISFIPKWCGEQIVAPGGRVAHIKDVKEFIKYPLEKMMIDKIGNPNLNSTQLILSNIVKLLIRRGQNV